MKQYLLLFLCCTALSVGYAQNPVLEIYYFHADNRCESDQQIEQETKNLVESVFAEELNNGKIILSIVNFMAAENQQVTDKYEIGWSTLLVNKIENGKEEVINLNDFAFTNIPANPELFRAGLQQQIRELMNP